MGKLNQTYQQSILNLESSCFSTMIIDSSLQWSEKGPGLKDNSCDSLDKLISTGQALNKFQHKNSTCKFDFVDTHREA